jgi:hypothetical protein
LRRQVQYLLELFPLPLEHFFCLLEFLDVGRDQIPPDDAALRIARRSSTDTKPAVYAVGAAVTVDMIVRMPCLERVRPRRNDRTEIIGMDRTVSAPIPHSFRSLSEIV